MEKWIVGSLLGLLGVGVIMPYILAPLELSYLSIAGITTLLEVTGITTINKIINIKDKRNHIKEAKNEKIIAQELVPVEEIEASNLLYANLESAVASYIIDEKRKTLQEQMITNLDISEKQKQKMQNEATIYEFMLQDIREESGKALTKSLKK